MNLKPYYLLGSLLLLLPSCAKEVSQDETSIQDKSDWVTIRVSVPREALKVSLTDDGDGLHTAWEETDKLRIFSGSQSAVYNISRIVSDHEAEFSGPALPGTSFDILYPGTYASVEEAEQDVQSPTQNGNGSTAHLRFKTVLQGVDNYSSISFSQTWAQAHGGSFKQCAAVKMKLALPAGITTLKKAGLLLNGKNYCVPLTDVDVSASGQVLTAYLMLPWEDIALPGGTAIPLFAMDTDNEVYSRTITISSDKTLPMGKLSTFGNTNAISGFAIQDFVGGDGSSSSPYLIANARQLDNMHKDGVLVAESVKYFKMIEDVDASTITNWDPLNAASPFKKAMDFNGDGHTISHLTSTGVNYASFSGVVNGLIHDVTFDSATISHDSKVGVVGGFVGTSGIVGNCTNVHVRNSSVTIPSVENAWAGGFAGEINTTGTLRDCSVENTSVDSKSHAGAFVGMVRNQAARIESCSVANCTLTQNNTPTLTTPVGLGGFAGHCDAAACFTACLVGGNVTLSTNQSKVATGGFIGYNNGNAHYENCTVEGSLSAPVHLSGKAETGGFVGYNTSPDGKNGAAFDDCVVKNIEVEGYNKLGGFIGYGTIAKYDVASILTGCSVEGVSVTQKLATDSGGIHTGGFAGSTARPLTFVKCTVKNTSVTATLAKIQNVGGFIGCTATSGSNFRDCSVDADCSVTAKANSVGGFVGWAYVPDSYKGCSSAATVTNSGDGMYTGGFVGHASSAPSFKQCIASGNVNSAYTYVGGFVGYAEASSYNECCYQNGTVHVTASGSNASCGGFAGMAYGDVCMVGCAVSGATVNVPSAGRIGGFVGQYGYKSTGVNNNSIISCSTLNTSVTGTVNTGAFVGVAYGDISESYVSGGSVTASGNACGGFGAFIQNSHILNCYTTATVNGGSYSDVGGFAGQFYLGSIENCYSAGTQNGNGSNRGAFVGVCKEYNSSVGSINKCIALSSLSFCADNSAGAAITQSIAGTDFTVKAKASELNWSTSVWSLVADLPTLAPGSFRIPVIFVGDSITWQWASSGRTDAKSKILSATNNILGNDPLPSYMTATTTKVDGETVPAIRTVFHPGFFSSHGYIDKGISGQTTTHMRDRFYKDVIVHNPRVLVLMGGTNDLGYKVGGDIPTTKQMIKDNIAFMADSASRAGIKVVLCSITPCNTYYSPLGDKKGQHIVELNSWIQSYCSQKEYTFCNYWSSLVAGDGDVANADDIGLGLKDRFRLYDALHPGPDAYTVMESIIQPILENLLNGTPEETSSATATLGSFEGNPIYNEL